MKEKKERKGYGILFVVCLICILFATFALLKVSSIQRSCNDYYQEYIEKNCVCGDLPIYNIGNISVGVVDESKDKNTNT